MIEDVISEDKGVNKSESRYNLQSQIQHIKAEENIEETTEESEEELAELQLPGNSETNIDLKNLQRANVLETVEGKNKPENIVGWLNDTGKTMTNRGPIG